MSNKQRIFEGAPPIAMQPAAGAPPKVHMAIIVNADDSVGLVGVPNNPVIALGLIKVAEHLIVKGQLSNIMESADRRVVPASALALEALKPPGT